MKRRSLSVALLAGVALLLAAAAASAAPPQYPAGWPLQPGGLRQIALSTGHRTMCRGPAGTVYEVTLGWGVDSYAAVERVRVSSGTTIKRWTYPATPGPGVIPYAAASDAAGNLFLAAQAQTPGLEDWVVLKFSSSGERLWRRSYDSGLGVDTPYALAVDHSGAVIVAGTSEQVGGYDAAVIKWSASGRLKWKRHVSAPGLDLLSAVGVDARDNVYAAGQRGGAGGAGTAIVRSWTSAGRRRWAATVVGEAAAPSWRLLEVKGTSVYVAGQTTGTPSDNGFMAMKYSTTGRRVWGGPQVLGFPHGSWVEGLAVDGKGAAVVGGTAYDAGASGQDAGAVWKIGAGGATAWSRTFTVAAWPHDGEFDAVGVDGAGRVYAAGGQYVTADAGSLLLVRYSPAGAEQAYWRVDGPADGHSAFRDLLVLGDTRVVAAGDVAAAADVAALYRAQTTP